LGQEQNISTKSGRANILTSQQCIFSFLLSSAILSPLGPYLIDEQYGSKDFSRSFFLKERHECLALKRGCNISLRAQPNIEEESDDDVFFFFSKIIYNIIIIIIIINNNLK
jgi:hypothetical protein